MTPVTKRFLETMLTPAVREAQTRWYGKAYPEFAATGPSDRLGGQELAFLAERDSFYLASVTEDGWPYIQHRGGPKGFLHALAPTTLAFADYGGNRQLVTTGSVMRNSKVALFAMDYPNRARLKILGVATVLDAREHQDLVAEIAPSGGHIAGVERVFRIEVHAFDWNCPKFITPRYSEEEVAEAVQPLRERIAELEAELARR